MRGRGPRLVYRDDRFRLERIEPPAAVPASQAERVRRDRLLRLGVSPASWGEWVMFCMHGLMGALLLAVAASPNLRSIADALVAFALIAALGFLMVITAWSQQRRGWSLRYRWLLLAGEVYLVCGALSAALVALRLPFG